MCDNPDVSARRGPVSATTVDKEPRDGREYVTISTLQIRPILGNDRLLPWWHVWLSTGIDPQCQLLIQSGTTAAMWRTRELSYLREWIYTPGRERCTHVRGTSFNFSVKTRRCVWCCFRIEVVIARTNTIWRTDTLRIKKSDKHTCQLHLRFTMTLGGPLLVVSEWIKQRKKEKYYTIISTKEVGGSERRNANKQVLITSGTKEAEIAYRKYVEKTDCLHNRWIERGFPLDVEMTCVVMM